MDKEGQGRVVVACDQQVVLQCCHYAQRILWVTVDVESVPVRVDVALGEAQEDLVCIKVSMPDDVGPKHCGLGQELSGGQGSVLTTAQELGVGELYGHARR